MNFSELGSTDVLEETRGPNLPNPIELDLVAAAPCGSSLAQYCRDLGSRIFGSVRQGSETVTRPSAPVV